MYLKEKEKKHGKRNNDAEIANRVVSQLVTNSTSTEPPKILQVTP